MSLYDIDVTTIDGKTQKMDDYRGKTLGELGRKGRASGPGAAHHVVPKIKGRGDLTGARKARQAAHR